MLSDRVFVPARPLRPLPPVNPYAAGACEDVVVLDDDPNSPFVYWTIGIVVTSVSLTVAAGQYLGIALYQYGDSSLHGWSAPAPFWIVGGLSGIVFSFLYASYRKQQPQDWERCASRAFSTTSMIVLPGHVGVLLIYLLICAALH